MKKLMLIVAGMLFISVVAVQAQEADTTVNPQKDSLSQEKSQTQTETQTQGSVNLRDMTVVKASEVPSSLRTTLQEAEYKGWDDTSSKIYRNKTDDMFVVQIYDGAMIKTYRFDKDGQPIKDQNR